MPVTDYGPNLQKLIDSGCIKAKRAHVLKEDHLEAIEKLSPEEVKTLIEVFRKVGGSENMWMI